MWQRMCLCPVELLDVLLRRLHDGLLAAGADLRVLQMEHHHYPSDLFHQSFRGACQAQTPSSLSNALDLRIDVLVRVVFKECDVGF